MQIQNIQNNNSTNFKGVIIIQNLKKGGKIIKRETSKTLDRELFDIAFRNICGGRYRYDEWRNIRAYELRDYADCLKYSKGLNLPETDLYAENAKLNFDDGMYSIEIPKKFRIWHSV